MIKFYEYKSLDYKDIVLKAVDTVLGHFKISPKDIDIEINIVDEEQIQQLNKRFRDIDSVTDVLSFANIEKKYPYDFKEHIDYINPEDNSIILGEIFICDKRALEQANEYNHSIEREISFLTCHGVLHLLGYDHIEEKDQEEMNKLQDKIMEEIMNKKEITTNESTTKEFKSGFIALMGKPNSGKSTLTNTLVGEKVSIVSWKPQTTRNKIYGIYNDENTQIVFIDTPGLHSPKNILGQYMMKNAKAALEGVDAVIYIIDGEKGIDDRDKRNIESYLKDNYNTIVIVNKIDHILKEKVFEILTELNDYTDLKAVIPVSALKQKNTDKLMEELKKLLTDNIKYYPDDMFTDKNMRFMVAEIIREKTLRLLDKEVPYGIGVDVTRYEYRKDGKIIDINADIICEKAAHKPIILGKGGNMIKKIATYSRQDIENMTASKVFLTVFVKVEENWRGSDYVMKELGYDIKK